MKYEYQVRGVPDMDSFTASPSTLQDVLDKMSEEGWRLVSVTYKPERTWQSFGAAGPGYGGHYGGQASGGTETGGTTLIFERTIKEI